MSASGGSVCGIVVAAGKSERMNGVDKVFAEVVGRPMIVWSLMAFRSCDAVDTVVVVAAPEAVARMERLVEEWRFTQVRAVVAGGADRQASVRAGLEAAGDAAIVVVHDGARSLVTAELIARGVALARESGAVICAVPSRDTVKEVEGEPPLIVATHDRSRMWLAQTPQVFDRELLLRAHAAAASSATDDAALVEALGHHVRVYEGSSSNLKVTSPEDIALAEVLLRSRLEQK